MVARKKTERAASHATVDHITRTTLPNSARDKLFFAQVREDPELEIAAVRPEQCGHVVVITSGLCTALSLLAAGADRVTAVDANITQNDVGEIKALAVARFSPEQAAAFLGGLSASPAERRAWYAELRPHLSESSRTYWDGRPDAIDDGILDSGVTEGFLRMIVWVLSHLIYSKRTLRQLMACQTVAEQQALYERKLNSWRWRFMFKVLLNRWVCRRVYDDRFFDQIDNPDFAGHFRSVVERALFELPVTDNYFLHFILEGGYRRNAMPRYLTEEGARRITERIDGLDLVDGRYDEYLRTQPDASIDAFTLSNICEWLTDEQIRILLEEIVRTARPNATLVLRNFLGWTDIPEDLRDVIVEDRAYGEAIIPWDRSVQYRIGIFTLKPTRDKVVRPMPAHATTGSELRDVEIREANPDDNAALSDLLRANPIRTHVSYVVDRAPDFEAIYRVYPGSKILVASARVDPARLDGCTGLLRYTAASSAGPVGVVYAGMVNRRPVPDAAGVGEALIRRAAEEFAASDADLAAWITNDTNDRVRRLEARTSGQGPVLDVVPLCSVDYTEVIPMRRQRLPADALIETPKTDDELAEVLEFVNRCYERHALAVPLTVADVEHWEATLPGFTRDGFAALRVGIELRAAALLFDPSRVSNITVVSLDAPTRFAATAMTALHRVARTVPEVPREGDVVRTLHLRRFAYRDAASARVLFGHLNNLALAAGKHSISYVADRRDPLPIGRRLTFKYPARLAGFFKPDAPIGPDAFAAQPVFLDVTTA